MAARKDQNRQVLLKKVTNIVDVSMFPSDYVLFLTAESKRNIEFKLHLPAPVAKAMMLFGARLKGSGSSAQQPIVPEDGKIVYVLFRTCC